MAKIDKDKICSFSKLEKDRCLHCKKENISELKNKIELLKNNKCPKSYFPRHECLHCVSEESRFLELLINIWSKEEEEIFKLKEQAETWKTAWYEQRDATGKNYWDGLKQGVKIEEKDFPYYGINK